MTVCGMMGCRRICSLAEEKLVSGEAKGSLVKTGKRKKGVRGMHGSREPRTELYGTDWGGCGWQRDASKQGTHAILECVCARSPARHKKCVYQFMITRRVTLWWNL